MTREHRAGCDNRTAIGAMGEGLDGAGDFVTVANADRGHLQPSGGRHGLNNTERGDTGREVFVAKLSHPGQVRRDLPEEIQPFAGETEFEDHKASYVATRSGQA